MYDLAFFPRSVPCATLWRKMLPVEMCGTPRYAASFAAWVPLPAPGGPSRTSLISRRERSQRSKDFGLGCRWLTWADAIPVWMWPIAFRNHDDSMLWPPDTKLMHRWTGGRPES